METCFADREKTVCFTGHRSFEGAPAAVLALDEAIAAAYAGGFRIFISGMAEGFDLAAAEAVVRLRERHPDVRLVAAVPFAAQAGKFGARDRERYAALLAAAAWTVILEPCYSHGCYFRRDDWMVDRSRRVVCWYDGSPGGTRYTVRRALSAGIEVVNLYREPGTLF